MLGRSQLPVSLASEDLSPSSASTGIQTRGTHS